jgi:hypothetical protein
MTKEVSGGWNVKDIVAHLSSWDEVSWLDFERAARGHLPFLLAWNDDIDEWNKFLMRGRLGFPLTQVRG